MSELPPIIIDTREQRPYSFYGEEVIHRKLDTGDYSLDGHEEAVAVERKSVDDYMSSISHDRERFEREIERSQSIPDFKVIIEASEQQIMDGDYYSEVAPLSAINTMKSWERRYGIEYQWANDRKGGKATTLDFLQDYHQSLQSP